MKKRILIISASILIVFVILTFVLYLIKVPPLTEISKARKSIADAQKIKSSNYANDLLQKANKHYNLAMKEWNSENERSIFFRDYVQARENAILANHFANEAIKNTKTKISNSEESIGIRISLLEKKIKDFDDKYSKFPFNKKDRNELAKSKLLLNEGIIAYKQANYIASKVKLDSVEFSIEILHELYEQHLNDYFSQYPQWEQWIDQTLSRSKNNNTYCIIVDKFARECILYKKGELLERFDVELGPNWLSDKNQQGDKSTPEGIYTIIKKLANGKTKYYMAFLLDYPNEDDKKRFLLNKKNGVIEKNAKIGNLIEIHGNGGQGIDWTDGCIAVKDSEMERLFKHCSEGTKVTIVGSVKPLNKLFLN
jgi:hypothetical protein